MKYIIQILICIFFIGMTKNIYAQNYGFKKDQKEDNSIDLNLHRDSTYTLISYYQPPKVGFIMLSIFSMGHFSTKDNKIYLCDEINNYTISLLSHQNKLYTEKGFDWMKEGYFILEHNDANEDARRTAMAMPKKSKITDLRVGLENNQKDKNFLIYGTYYFNKHFQITIGENKKYKVFRYNFVFSEGVWERKENVLLLYDKDVDGPFSIFINNDSSLTSIVIPGDYLMREFQIE